MKANNTFNAVMELDLEPIKNKLMHVESGQGWSQEKANAVEKEYRRFLCLMKQYPGEDTAPMVDVDTFWHYHILDTMKYARDCEQAFGYFLHHYPYVGMRGEDDALFRIDSGERMRILYEATFGEAYPGLRDGVASAFCAGPSIEAGASTAFCAGPSDKQASTTDGAATAFCAGPSIDAGKSTAFCAGPSGKQLGARDGAATAFCAGPSGRHDGAMANRAVAAAKHAS